MAQPKRPETQRFDELLTSLRSIDRATWNARIKAIQEEIGRIQQKIKADETQARGLRQQAQKLESQARKKYEAVTRLNTEVKRYQDLMALVGPKARPLALVEASPQAKPSKQAKPNIAAKATPKPAPKGKARPAAKKSAKTSPKKPAVAAKAKTKPKAVAKTKPKTKPVAKATPVAKAKAKPKAKPVAKAKPPVKAQGRPTLLNFEDHALPILEQHCIGCHNPDDSSGGLDISTYDALMQGGGSGSVVRKGDSESSRLWRLVAHQDSPTMPPDQSPIPEAQQKTLARWIQDGAFATEAAIKAQSKKKAKAAPPAETKPKTKAKPKANSSVKAKPKGASNARPNKAKSTPKAKTPKPKTMPVPAKASLVQAKKGERWPVVRGLATSPKAPLIAVPGHEQIVFYRPNELKALGAFPFEKGRVEAMEFSSDGERLLVVGGTPGKSGLAILYNVRSGEIEQRFGRAFDTYLACSISPGQSVVALGGANGKVTVFDRKSGKQRYEVKEHEDWVLAVDISPDGNFLASADRSGMIVVSEADTGLNVHKIKSADGAINTLAYRPDAKFLASGGKDGSIRFFEMEDGKQKQRRSAGQGELLTLAWSKDLMLASSGTKGPLKLWDASIGPKGNFPKLNDWCYGLGFIHNGTQLYAGSWGGNLYGFNVKTKTPVGLANAQ